MPVASGVPASSRLYSSTADAWALPLRTKAGHEDVTVVGIAPHSMQASPPSAMLHMVLWLSKDEEDREACKGEQHGMLDRAENSAVGKDVLPVEHGEGGAATKAAAARWPSATAEQPSAEGFNSRAGVLLLALLPLRGASRQRHPRSSTCDIEGHK